MTWWSPSVLDVVAAAVAQVDAAEVGDVAARGRRGAAARRTSGGASRRCAPACRAGTGRRPRRSRCRAARDFSEWKPNLFQCERQSRPRTSAPRRAAADEGRRHRRRRVVGQPLVRVAAPVDEVEEVALPQRADPLVQLGHVGPAVDDGRTRLPSLHATPSGWWSSMTVWGLSRSAGAEEEVGEHAAILPVPRGAPERTVVGRCARRDSRPAAPTHAGMPGMRVVLAEDSVLLRQGLVALLTEHPAVAEVIEAGDLGELLDAVSEQEPDVVLADIRMPPTHTDEGIRAAERFRRTHPSSGSSCCPSTPTPRGRWPWWPAAAPDAATCSRSGSPTSSTSSSALEAVRARRERHRPARRRRPDAAPPALRGQPGRAAHQPRARGARPDRHRARRTRRSPRRCTSPPGRSRSTSTRSSPSSTCPPATAPTAGSRPVLLYLGDSGSTAGPVAAGPAV